MKITLLIIALLSQIGGWAYVVEPLKRTRMGAFETSIGNDVVAGVYVVAVLGVAAPAWLLMRGKSERRGLSIALVVTGVALLVCFAWLNWTGKVGQYVKAES